MREAERLGVDSVWVAEAWGYDALTPLTNETMIKTDTTRRPETGTPPSKTRAVTGQRSLGGMAGCSQSWWAATR